MTHSIGIRKEDKNKWERRVPVVPADLEKLAQSENLKFKVQSSPIRIFSDQSFEQAGAEISGELETTPVVLAVKEIPKDLLVKNTTYMFFSHTVKGQSYNMDMLRQLMDKKCSLIDYERIADDQGRRLVFFGRHAGLAGMVDTLRALGQRMIHEGIPQTPLGEIKAAYQYEDLGACKTHLKQIGEKIVQNGIPGMTGPLVVGFAGYGNVSAGAQEILYNFPVETVLPGDLAQLTASKTFDPCKLYKVVFREQDMFCPLDPSRSFDLNTYFTRPELYTGCFETFLPHLTVLVNCIYWDTPYPVLVTKQYLKQAYGKGKSPRLKVIGDITCDIEGSIACTTKATPPDNPVYVYDPETGRVTDGVQGPGPVIMAVDNLPCEFPKEASETFSRALFPFLPALARADYTTDFNRLDLPAELKRAMILFKGEFTEDYRFMEKFLS
ncbi:MAG: hypothetical protein HUK40_02425 [Desulfobacter sp.]|nr:hypothetical protein [Desulfobacter sp.]WDP85334.1 MAG: hypothetical protein HUN05_09485 [Desulfobacter sp.]